MRFTIVTAALLLVAAAVAAGLCGWWHAQSWTRWDAFQNHFIQDDGRVVDRTDAARSTSESQAYGLFFALVANDPDTFASILRWTHDNLAGGDLGASLPAWLWGEREDGSWGIKDENPASDADLWIAYTLMEAARLWQVDSYRDLAHRLLGLVAEREVHRIADGPQVLLPAPFGFVSDEGVVRVNPSYVPGFQFRYFAEHQPQGPWGALLANHNAITQAASPAGFAPDWVAYVPESGVQPDGETDAVGSYDAIRVYMWAAMSGSAELLNRLDGMAEYLQDHDYPPERVDTRDGRSLAGAGPVGFSAALLPYLEALGDDKKITKQRARLNDASHDGLFGPVPAYYDHVLALFGEGWLQRWYRIDDSGRLNPRWECSCWSIFDVS